MNILFFMKYSGYLKFYESTLRMLAERGHTVYLAYNKIDKVAPRDMLPADAHHNIILVGVLPSKNAPWTALTSRLRCTIDYLRFLDPHFKKAPWSRARTEVYLPREMAFLKKIPSLNRSVVRAILKAAAWLERLIPPDPAVQAFIRERSPDAVVVTPVVLPGRRGVRETEVVKCARAMGVPVALGCASWDHLTSKGLIRVEPDMIIVWNDTQKREAVDLHHMPAARVVTTGAQLFDQWFDNKPRLTRDQFLERVGLPSERGYLLYLGSQKGITDPQDELKFILRWVGLIRNHPAPELRDLSIIVRPHPFNCEHWNDEALAGLSNVAIWPRTERTYRMSERDELEYFHSLYHSSAVVGINTSAMIEAAIVGRPVHSIQVDEFRRAQDGSLHFQYLLMKNGGCVRLADGFDEHFDQLLDVLRDPAFGQREIRSFVHHFVRPQGLDRPSTPIVCDAIERLGALPVKPQRMPAWMAPLRGLVRLAASALAWRDGDAKIREKVTDAAPDREPVAR